MSLIYLCRFLEFIPYLNELEGYNMMYATASRLAKPFFYVLLTLYLVAYVFREIGEAMYGGKLTYEAVQDAADGDDLMFMLYNFNDFWGGIMVFSVLIVSNNWNDLVDLYSDATSVPQWVTRTYFMFFYFFIGLIMLNIIISFVLELYAVAEPEVRS